MTKRWNPYYRSSNGLLAKTNREVGRLLYGDIFLIFFYVGYKLWGPSIGLVTGIIGDVVYALVWFILRKLLNWDH